MSVILMYHSVGCQHAHETIQVRPETLARQLQWVADEGFQWCSLHEALTQPREKVAAITFDDGFADVFRTAELLQSASIPTTLFVCPGLLGGVSSWTTSPATRSLPLLQPEQVRLLSKEGIRIAPHGWTHHPFTALELPELDRDLRQCNEWFAEYLGFLPDVVAYPYGSCNATSAAVVETFYDYGIAVEPVGAVAPRYAVPRIAALESSTKEWFCRQLRHYSLDNFFSEPLCES